MSIFKKAAAFIFSAVTVVSVSAVCFADGWTETDDGMKYLDSNNKAVTGFKTIDGSKYYFSKNGVMKIGWLKAKDGKYYFDSEGKMATGLVKIGSSKYYFSKKGIMQTGWQTVSGKKYYFESSGKMAVNKTLTIDGKSVKFNSKGEVSKTSGSSSSKKEKKETTPTVDATIEFVDTKGRHIEEAYLTKGVDYILEYVITPESLKNNRVSFTSTNTGVANVTTKGVILTDSTGSAIVTVSLYDGGKVVARDAITINVQL